MEMTFSPSLCDGQKFSGSVTIRGLSYDERLDLYDELDMSEVPEDEGQAKKAYLKTLRAVGKKSKDFVKSVNIKRLSDGKEYIDWDEVYHASELVPVVTEVCGNILGKM
jgi:hypothetical protein